MYSAMTGLPPIPPGPKKVLRFKDEEAEEDAPDRRNPPRFPSLQRRASLLAYEPIIATFVKNGDKFFEGTKLNITQRNMRNWDTLLAELSRRIDLPAGVRNIYTPEGGHRVKSLSQLEHQKTYVCASSEPFKRIDYKQVKNPDWKTGSRIRVSDAGLFSKDAPPLDPNLSLNASARSLLNMSNSVRSWTEVGLDTSTRQQRFFQRRKPSVRLSSISEPGEVALTSPQRVNAERMTLVSPIPELDTLRPPAQPLPLPPAQPLPLPPAQPLPFPPAQPLPPPPAQPLPPPPGQPQPLPPLQSQSPPNTPRMLEFTIIRNAPPPREHTVVYISKSSMETWEEATQLISRSLKTINGCLRLFRLDGREVLSLQELWEAGNTLVAAGNERFDIVEFLKGESVHASEETAKSSAEQRQHPSQFEPVESKEPPTPANDVKLKDDSAEPQERTEHQEERTASLGAREEGNERTSSGEREQRAETATKSNGDEERTSKSREEREEMANSTDQTDHQSPATANQTMESNSEPSVIITQKSIMKVSPTKEPSSDEQNTSAEIDPEGVRSKKKKKRVVLSDSSAEETNPVPFRRRMSLQYSPVTGSSLPQQQRRMSLSLQPQNSSPLSSSYPLVFPPTPPSEISLGSRRRPRPRRLISMLEEARPISNSSSLLESPLLRARFKKSHTQREHLHPHTPLSEISLDVVQSVVDMVVGDGHGETTFPVSDGSTLSNLSSNGSQRQIQCRNVSIQTNFVEEQLSSFAETEEVLKSTKKRKYEQKPPSGNANVMSSQVDLTEDLDSSTAAAQLHHLTKEKYHIGMSIVEGSFATVKHCTDKQENSDFLLRVIQKASVFGHDDKILQEVEIMRMVKHGNVQSVLDYWETSSEMCMVMEPIEGGDLFDAILHCQHFSESDAMEAMRQLGLALVYLHANRIVHRGVKPESIFLSLENNGTWTLKLAGFSLATRMTEPLTLMCGNEHYRAPEMSAGSGYGTKADVWSAGVIAYILLSGIMPFRRRKKSDIISNSCYSQLSFPDIYWEEVTEEAKDFIRHLLEVSPHERYSSSHLMQHSWLQRPYVKSEYSKKLVEYLINQAAMKVASVPILTVTALDHDVKKRSRRRKSINQKPQQQQQENN